MSTYKAKDLSLLCLNLPKVTLDRVFFVYSYAALIVHRVGQKSSMMERGHKESETHGVQSQLLMTHHCTSLDLRLFSIKGRILKKEKRMSKNASVEALI